MDFCTKLNTKVFRIIYLSRILLYENMAFHINKNIN